MFYYQIPLRMDIPLSALQPVDAIKNIKAPVLVIAGSHDLHTTLSESKQLYRSAPAPKEFWQVDGAGHTDFYRFAPEQYKKVITTFLSRSVAKTN